MEVISKELHKNLLPIMLIVFVLFLIIAVLSTSSGVLLARGLVTQVVHVEAGKNGLAHISTEKKQMNLGDVGDVAGSVSNRSILLEATAQEVR